MKKLHKIYSSIINNILSLFMISILLFSCTSENSNLNAESDNTLSPALTAEYFNSFLIQKDIKNTLVKRVKKISAADLYRIRPTYAKTENNYEEENSTSITLEVKNKLKTFHIIPRLMEPFKADLYIETHGVISTESLEITIKDTETSYEVNWIKHSNLKLKNNSDGCNDGASKVMKVGGAIAFGGFFGCLPCPFVGGAVATIAGVMSLFC
jgi:hypothetical protein